MNILPCLVFFLALPCLWTSDVTESDLKVLTRVVESLHSYLKSKSRIFHTPEARTAFYKQTLLKFIINTLPYPLGVTSRESQDILYNFRVPGRGNFSDKEFVHPHRISISLPFSFNQKENDFDYINTVLMWNAPPSASLIKSLNIRGSLGLFPLNMQNDALQTRSDVLRQALNQGSNIRFFDLTGSLMETLKAAAGTALEETKCDDRRSVSSLPIEEVISALSKTFTQISARLKAFLLYAAIEEMLISEQTVKIAGTTKEPAKLFEGFKAAIEYHLNGSTAKLVYSDEKFGHRKDYEPLVFTREPFMLFAPGAVSLAAANRDNRVIMETHFKSYDHLYFTFKRGNLSMVRDKHVPIALLLVNMPDKVKRPEGSTGSGYTNLHKLRITARKSILTDPKEMAAFLYRRITGPSLIDKQIQDGTFC